MDGSVLLVDDEPKIPKAISRLLRHEGFKIFTAHNSSEALEVLAAEPINVIVSDHRMPGMKGADLMIRIREDFPETVRIMLTGEADMEDVAKAINEGSIYKFITKPWRSDNLRTIIKEAVVVAQSQQAEAHQGEAAFLRQIPATTHSRVAILEARNPSVLKVLNTEQMEHLLNTIQLRCDEHLPGNTTQIFQLDESLFAFSCGQTDHNTMATLADELNQPIYSAEQIVPLRTTIGYADLHSDLPAEQTLRQAKIALTATSFAGEVTAYNEDIQRNLSERHSLERDMRYGLKNNEFFLQFQPQVCGRDLCIRGAEALCRWQHPSKGYISPQQFIDLAEQNGFIHELGAWVINESCRISQLLADRGHQDVRLSFNISPRQFSAPGWVDIVLANLTQMSTTRGLLEVEITESTVMDNPDRALSIMTKLKDAGAHLALDDFGTGHSSLGLLNELPIDTLKFDRCLIQDVTESARSRTLFTRLVEMTHELGLECIAEGVETQDQVHLCQTLGCDRIQGFAFYTPMGIPDLLLLTEQAQIKQ